ATNFKIDNTGHFFAPSLSTSNTGNYLCWNSTTFEIEQNATACSLSSLRYKENIRSLSYGLDEIMRMRPIFYDLKSQYGTAKNQPGFIAEEAYAIVPNLVPLDKDGNPDNFDYPKFSVVLAKAIQEQQAEIVHLQGLASST